MRLLASIVAALMFCLSTAVFAQPAGYADANEAIMIEAARALTFATPGNRAFLLVKLETVRSPVAVIFGYVDNAAACEQIAAALNASQVGTFDCDAIY